MSGQQDALAALYPRKDPVPILQEAGWAPGSVCTGGKSRLHQDSIPDRPAPSHLKNNKQTVFVLRLVGKLLIQIFLRNWIKFDLTFT